MSDFARLLSGFTLAAAAGMMPGACPAALVIHYSFDGDAGTTALDSATADGQQNLSISNGTFVNDPQRGDVLSLSAGAIGSLSFTATTGSYSFAGWYKGSDSAGYWYDQGAGNRLIVSLSASTSQDASDGGAAAGMGVYEGSWINSGGTSWNDDQWRHMAWVFEADGLGPGVDSLSIYLDGVAQDVDLGTAGFQDKRAITIRALGGTQRLFARYSGGSGLEHLEGLVDDYRVYDHALTAGEVSALVPEPSGIVTVGLLVGGILVARRSRSREDRTGKPQERCSDCGR